MPEIAVHNSKHEEVGRLQLPDAAYAYPFKRHLLYEAIRHYLIKRANEVEADGFIPKCDPKELAVQLKKYL